MAARTKKTVRARVGGRPGSPRRLRRLGRQRAARRLAGPASRESPRGPARTRPGLTQRRKKHEHGGNQRTGNHPAHQGPARRRHAGRGRRRGRNRRVRRRRHRARLRSRQGHGGRAPRIPERRLRPRAEPRGGPRRLRPHGRDEPRQGRRHRQAHEADHLGARRRGARRPRRQPARAAARRQGPDRVEGVLPGRAHRSRRRRPHARQGADADRASRRSTR